MKSSRRMHNTLYQHLFLEYKFDRLDIHYLIGSVLQVLLFSMNTSS